MSDVSGWQVLAQELDRWQAAGRVARLWLRDDDAVEPSPALERLLALAGGHAVPVTLAVIPENTGEPLRNRLAATSGIHVAVHGWSHRNHAPAGQKKQELGAHRPASGVTAELAAGFAKLSALHGPRFVPMLVPPWNRIDASVVEALPPLGFRLLSVFGPEKAGPLRLVNTHVDLMDWHGTGGGRDHDVLAAELAARLAVTFDTGAVAGILTHHLVHDAAAWKFLEILFTATAAHAACRWETASALL